ncbi:MAG: TlpA family protein disulfide reductase [Rhizobiales bacterium]|nr:TlpA family protein disulfide reductase [Hyphomicrobiales bacterium]
MRHLYFCLKAGLAAALLFALASNATAENAATAPAGLQGWKSSAPASFRLDDLHGQPRDLQAFKGKVVLLHFFATWCEPCVAEIASLQRLTSIMRGQPLAVVAIDVAEIDLKVRAFFEKNPADFAVLLDRDRAIARSWKISALPSTVVLDPELSPRLFVEGDLDWSRPDIVTTLKALYPAGASAGGK